MTTTSEPILEAVQPAAHARPAVKPGGSGRRGPSRADQAPDRVAGTLEAAPDPASLDSRILDGVGVAMYVTDQDGRITFFNEAAVQLWGRRPSIGEPWCGSLRLFRLDGQPMPHAECPMAIALRERRPIRDVEAILERPDGSRAWFRPYPTPIVDSNGRLTGAVNVLVDLTQQRKAEEALRAAATALAASNAVKDEFLGLISHELRTPITTVLGNARLLRDRGASIPADTRASMIADIAAESERLLGIVENLLLLTKLESGVRPDSEPQVLAHVVRMTVEAFRRRHPDRPIALRGEPRHLIVDADRPYLELLLDNLLSNADKYGAEGLLVEVIVGGTEREATVTVLDRGIGLDDADAARLFTPFYRSRAAKARTAGVGIGLAVCRRVAEALGGRTWAAPREGGGSAFGFALPLSELAEAGSAAE